MRIFIARHAKAGNRRSDGRDRYRPLVPEGHEQANQIAQFFESQTLTAIYSSPAVRCRQTVEPAAVSKSLPVIETEALWEDSLPAEIVDEINATTAEFSLWCSHGNLIPAVLETLEIEMINTTRRGAVKGSIWVVEGEPNNWRTASYLAPGDLV